MVRRLEPKAARKSSTAAATEQGDTFWDSEEDVSDRYIVEQH